MTPRLQSLLLCLLAPFTLASPPTTSPTTQPLDALIAQLSSDNAALRQRAQDQLTRLGPAAVPALETLLQKSTDEEALTRARAALRAISEDRVVGPTLVTLHVGPSHPKGAFAEFAQQVGCQLQVEPPELWTEKDWPTIHLDAVEQPFWSVLLDLCRQTGLEPDLTDPGLLKLTNVGDADWATFPSVVAGPMLIQATQLTTTRTVKLGKAPNPEQSSNLALTVYAEPKLRVLHESASATIEAVTDELGHSLLSDDAREVALAGAGRSWDLEVTLAMPEKVGHKLASFRGTLHLIVPVKVESTQFSDVLSARNVSHTVGGRRLLLKRVHKVQGSYEVQVTVFRDGLSDEEWEQLTNPTDFVRLLDDKDRPLPFMGVTGNDEATDKQATVTLQFEAPIKAPNNPAGQPLPGKPTKLVWDIPTDSRELHLPFELKNLPLP